MGTLCLSFLPNYSETIAVLVMGHEFYILSFLPTCDQCMFSYSTTKVINFYSNGEHVDDSDVIIGCGEM